MNEWAEVYAQAKYKNTNKIENWIVGKFATKIELNSTIYAGWYFALNFARYHFIMCTFMRAITHPHTKGKRHDTLSIIITIIV